MNTTIFMAEDFNGCLTKGLFQLSPPIVYKKNSIRVDNEFLDFVYEGAALLAYEKLLKMWEKAHGEDSSCPF